MNDPVNHPKHYTEHPSGVECIQITEHMNFCLGNAVKYIWRADLKGGIEDLQKAAWYIDREIKRRQQNAYQRKHPKARINTTISGADIAPGSLTGWQSKHADET